MQISQKMIRRKTMYRWGISSESQIRAQAKYDAEHTTRISLKLNLRTDRDIIRWLEKQTSMQGAIKKLIRREIAGMNAEDKNDVRHDG